MEKNVTNSSYLVLLLDLYLMCVLVPLLSQ